MKNRLYDLRQENDILQEDLANRIGISQQKISRYEQGIVSKVDFELEEKLCDYFNCSLDYLRCRSSIRNEQQYSDTLKNVLKVIEDFYNDGNEKKQDLTNEELASFLELISQFKDLLKKFPKKQ